MSSTSGGRSGSALLRRPSRPAASPDLRGHNPPEIHGAAAEHDAVPNMSTIRAPLAKKRAGSAGGTRVTKRPLYTRRRGGERAGHATLRDMEPRAEPPEPLPIEGGDPVRPPWRLTPEEIPPELADNPILRGLVTLSPKEEELLEHLALLDRRDPGEL